MVREGKQKDEKRKYTTITIPTFIYERIQSKIENTSFNTVSDYVTFVLRETGSEVAASEGNSENTDRFVKRLKALGYE